MEKYIPFIGLKHNWESINCLSLIRILYQKFLNKEFLPNIDVTAYNANWLKVFDKAFIENEIKNNWIKKELKDIKEFDILVFTRRNKINHFGMYIGQNKYIHVSVSSYVRVDELNEDARERLYAICGMKNT